MTLYPEWFIGGPWHGKDKRTVCPNLQGMVTVAVSPSLQEIFSQPDPNMEMGVDHIHYVPRSFAVFGQRLIVWLTEEDASSIIGTAGTGALVNPIDRGQELMRMIGELIMAPHAVVGGHAGYDVGAIAEQRSSEWQEQIDRERWADQRYAGTIDEYRRTISQQRAQIDQLSRQVRRESMGDQWRYFQDTESVPAIKMELAADGLWWGVDQANVTTYLDQGDGTEESPPAWVATAQTDHGPITGYGTNVKAALIAMAADACQVYARMIDISEKPRMR
jgi:hypothetical protein